ncbi:MAG: vancomycin high temperature exclusion protein [Solirubrobacteraceae bacterium]
MKIIFNLFFLVLLSFLTIIIGCNFYIKFSVKNQLYDSINSIPYNKVGMVLGTSKYLKNRELNLYFINRMEAAIALYKAKKIDFILVSGDNRNVNYNEPKQMTIYLLNKGIPEDRIILDYAGRRTLDSVLRAHTIFNLKKFTIISQKFHNERAVFIANKYKMQVVAFNAKTVKPIIPYIKNEILREYLARVKAVLDLLNNVKPQVEGLIEPILVPKS